MHSRSRHSFANRPGVCARVLVQAELQIPDRQPHLGHQFRARGVCATRRMTTVLAKAAGTDDAPIGFLPDRTLRDVAERYRQDPQLQTMDLLSPDGTYIAVGLDMLVSAVPHSQFHADTAGKRYLVVRVQPVAGASSGQAGAGVGAGAATGIDLATMETLLQDKLAPIRMALERNASSTVAASSITYEELAVVRDSIGAVISFTSTSGDPDALTRLLSASPANVESFWEPIPEPSQRSRYSECLQRNVSTPRRFTWVDASSLELKMLVRGECFKLASKNDELLIIRGYHSEPALGAVLGVEAKKALTQEGLRQAEAEFYVFARYSMFPYAQVITDFTTGGVVFYSDRNEQGKVHVTVHTVEGMRTLFAFITTMLRHIPDKAGDRNAVDAEFMPAELPTPKRIKPTGLSQPLSVAEAFRMLCGLQGYDLACEEDLEGFDLPTA